MAAVGHLDMQGIRSPMAPLMLSWGSAAATGGPLASETASRAATGSSAPAVCVESGQDVAEGRARAVGGDQNRRLFAGETAFAGLAAVPARLAIQLPLPLPALENEGLVRLHDPGTPIRRYRRQEAVAPAMRRARRNPAAPGSLPDRLASEAPCASRRFPLSGSDLPDGHRLPECGGPDQADDRPAIEAARLKPPPMLFWDPPNQHPQASRTGAQEQLNRPLATTSEQLRERDDAGRLLSRWMAISPVEGRRAGERVRR